MKRASSIRSVPLSAAELIWNSSHRYASKAKPKLKWHIHIVEPLSWTVKLKGGPTWQLSCPIQGRIQKILFWARHIGCDEVRRRRRRGGKVWGGSLPMPGYRVTLHACFDSFHTVHEIPGSWLWVWRGNMSCVSAHACPLLAVHPVLLYVR